MTALWTRFTPGLAAVSIIALAATFVSEHYAGPQFLYALFFGISFNFLSSVPEAQAGIDVAAQTILRLGVALLGVRITIAQIASLGAMPIALVICCVAVTILFGSWLARSMKYSVTDGVLTGGAVAICGASAALAISAVCPQDERTRRFTLLTVVGVTLLSTVAMVTYPLAIKMLGLDDTTAGIFIGGTVHDIAQVVGAGYMISPVAGDSATYVKLTRVALLLPVVWILGWTLRDGAGRAPVALPWFLVVFAILVLVASLGVLSPRVVEALSTTSRWCLVAAIAGLGIKTSFRDFMSLGWGPLVLMVSETIFLAAVFAAGLVAFR